MLIEFEEEYDDYERGEYFKMIFFENLLPNLNDDIPYSLSICESRYDLFVPHGPFAGASYLGYYYKDTNCIDIEIKSKQGALYFNNIFKYSTPINVEYCKLILEKFRFLYYFIYGKEYEHNDINKIEDIFKYFRYDGDNFNFQIINKSNDLNTFSSSWSGVIDVSTGNFSDYHGFYLGLSNGKIKNKEYFKFKTLQEMINGTIDIEICKKLNISSKDITIKTHDLLVMLNY